MQLFGRLMLVQAVACAAFAQEYLEVGAIGGFAFARGLSVTNATGTATAGFKNGGTFGAFFGGDSHERWGGEVRYLYRMSDLSLGGSGASVKFDAHTHIIHGDILAYFKHRAAKVRPYIAFGGGVKFIQGTAVESATQPLGRFAALTHTDEALGVYDVGGGVKYSLSKSVRLRFEARDYISKRPNKVIAPAPGAKISGILNDVLVNATISYSW
ncbi:MAG: outer membrane beta-barrel protein [Acidobacteria bacterium]|nr:outer membrane beta-barrel protein [Acidobacteriota bacterium]